MDGVGQLIVSRIAGIVDCFMTMTRKEVMKTMGYYKNLMIAIEDRRGYREELDDFLMGQAEEIWYPQPFSENELIPF